MLKVDHFNYEAFKYNEANASILESFCQPFSRYGLTTFAYFRFFPSGKYLYLCNNLDWVSFCLQKIQHNDTSLGREISNAKNDDYYCYLWPVEISDSLLAGLYEFDIWNGLSIFKELPDGSIELWGFASNRANENISSYYLDHIEEIKKFTQHFNSKASDIILPNSDNLAIYKSHAYNKQDTGFDIENPGLIDQFINSIDLRKYPIITHDKEVYLSKSSLSA